MAKETDYKKMWRKEQARAKEMFDALKDAIIKNDLLLKDNKTLFMQNQRLQARLAGKKGVPIEPIDLLDLSKLKKQSGTVDIQEVKDAPRSADLDNDRSSDLDGNNSRDSIPVLEVRGQSDKGNE